MEKSRRSRQKVRDMKRKNNRVIWKLVIGIAAILCIAALLFFAGRKDRQKAGETAATKALEVTISFETEELVYDGSRVLDLMEGVSAADQEGNDKTGEVEAALLSGDSLTQKRIRYRLFDENGREVTRERRLVLKGYTGPTVTVTDNLELEASELTDLIGVLGEEKKLSAQDGFARDITDQVTCKRKKTGDGVYEMEFQVRNEFQDVDQVTVTAHIEGEVSDPVIELYEDEVLLTVGSEWDPYSYVEQADDGMGDALDQVQVDSSVNTAVPGTYHVVYQLDSHDHTAETSAVLRVIVQ